MIPAARPRYLNKIAIGGLLLIFFSTGFVLGQVTVSPRLRTLNDAVRKLTGKATQADFALLTDAWDLINNKYVGRPIDKQKLIRGAVEGMVASLDDPYSFYLAPNDAKSFEDEINGKFEGIGAELAQRDHQIVVVAPLANSPSERAGLKTGDQVLAVDGVSSENKSLDEVVRSIRGKKGTKVKLTIARNGQPSFDLEIVRDKITVESITLSYRKVGEKNVAVIRISSFAQDTGKLFNEIARTIILKQPSGLILDLRSNPGGYLDAAVDIADQFIGSGAIVTEDLGGSKQETITADSGAPLEKFRTVILIDKGSASAAEILAGALRDRLKTPLVGEQSFGKGSVQEIEELSDGSSLKITIAKWLTPGGTSIDKSGLTPDVVVVNPDNAMAGVDPQFDRALELALP